MRQIFASLLFALASLAFAQPQTVTTTATQTITGVKTFSGADRLCLKDPADADKICFNAPALGSATISLTTPAVTGTLATLNGTETLTNKSIAATQLTGNLAIARFNSGTSASSSTFWRGDGVWATPAMVKLDEVVTAASQATVTFSSISGAYKHLKLVIAGRDNSGAATVVGVSVLVNGDTTAANYTSAQWLDGFGTTAQAATDAASVGGVILVLMSGTSGLATAMGITELLIPMYAQTTFHKQFISNTSAYYSGPTIRNRLVSAVWKSTAAITSITVSAFSTFTDGSTFSLYGLN